MRTGGKTEGSNEPASTHRETQMTQDFTRTDLDNYRRKHLTAKNADYISKHNEKLIKDFYTTIKGTMDKQTEQKYLIRWKMLFKRYIDSNKEGIETEKLDDLTRMEWSQIMDDLQEDEEKNYADTTIDTFKNAIRYFYKKRHLKFRRPDRVKAILQSDTLEDMVVLNRSHFCLIKLFYRISRHLRRYGSIILALNEEDWNIYSFQ